jgi:hypothetical protein
MEAATARMQQAAAQQRYELAGQLKDQLAFAGQWKERWLPVVRPATEFNLLLAVPATRRKAWKLFCFGGGELHDGPLLADRKLPTETPPWLAGVLGQTPGGTSGQPGRDLDDEVRMEQTWLVAHFLQHKESRAAIAEFLPDNAAPPDLDTRLADALQRRRAK